MDMELRWKKKMNTKCNKENIMKIPTTPKNKKIAQSKSYKSITAIATLHDFILFIYNFLCYTDDDIYIYLQLKIFKNIKDRSLFGNWRVLMVFAWVSTWILTVG